ncbi:tetratricopeptide repeat protein [Nocardia gipuzkoensis]
MGGRLALVVGSECDAMPRLGFVEELAVRLAARLKALGHWTSGSTKIGALLSPTAAELNAAVKAAFEQAAEQQAALLIAFVGHGVSTGPENFFLMARDSPRLPDSGSGLHLTQVLSEQLDRYSVDGLIVMVDACETHESLLGAARRLTDRVELSAQRLELLVASGRHNAYDGCFTRTVLTVFDRGLPERGENLLPVDLLKPLASVCPLQVPGHFGVAHGGDRGLWLVPNVARRDDAVWNRPAAGLVDALTGGVIVTDTFRRRVVEVFNTGHLRLRGVVGPAGSGKSTLLSLLIRPNLLGRTPFNADFVTAAVFVSSATSFDAVASELSQQLRRRIDGFADAADRTHTDLGNDPEHDVFDIGIIEPLARTDTFGQPVTLVFDGLDQAEPGTRELLASAIEKLVTRDDLAHVRVIVGIRAGSPVEKRPVFAGMHRIQLAPPKPEEISRAVAAAHSASAGHGWEEQIQQLTTHSAVGGWLLARLLTELDTRAVGPLGLALDVASLVRRRIHRAEREIDASAGQSLSALLAILAAAGSGPVLPIELAALALSELGHPGTASGLRDRVVALGTLVSRGSPGTDEELLGLAHDEFVTPVRIEAEISDVVFVFVHRAIADAIEQVGRAVDDSVTPTVRARAEAYARGSGARHLLAAGDSDAALDLLTRLGETPRAADNRDTWASWLPTFQEFLGPDHPHTFELRSNLGYWRGVSGDNAGAIQEFQQLLSDQQRVLGADHPDILASRGNVAAWRAEAGDLAGAIREVGLLLTDQQRVLGADHRDTLLARRQLARWRAANGDIGGAIREFELLLTDQQRVLGAHDRDTLGTRESLARWRGAAGDLGGAIREFDRLLTDRSRELGADHPDTFSTRNSLAYWRGTAGDVAGALRELEGLLPDQIRVLGADHPDVFITRRNLASWRGVAGNLTSAIQELELLLIDQQRVLAADHLDTLRTREDLARWRGEAGDIAGAIREFEQLGSDQLRVLGANHPDTLGTRYSIASWHGAAGKVGVAVRELEQLLTDQLRVLGADHPHIFSTRHNLAFSRGEAGNLTAALRELEQLLADQTRVLGADHPDTVGTRRSLARWRGEAGDFAVAVPEHEAILALQQRLLGAEHVDTLDTRNRLAYWRGAAGDIAVAIRELEQLIIDQQRVLGADDPLHLTTRESLARWWSEGGNVVAAIREYEQLLTDHRRVLGADHPETLDIRFHLARCRGTSGDIATAIRELEELLTDQGRVLDADHPHTFRTRSELALRRGENGNIAAAIRELEELLTDQQRVLSADHPDIRTTRRNLARCTRLRSD